MLCLIFFKRQEKEGGRVWLQKIPSSEEEEQMGDVGTNLGAAKSLFGREGKDHS